MSEPEDTEPGTEAPGPAASRSGSAESGSARSESGSPESGSRESGSRESAAAPPRSGTPRSASAASAPEPETPRFAESAEQPASASGAPDSGAGAARPGAVRAAAGQGAQQGFLAEVWDAVSVRTLLLVVGVLFLQLGFVFSYVGAFHHPTPHRISVAVVAPPQNRAQLAGRLNAISGKPLHATAVANEATARRKLANGDTSAVLVVNASGSTDRLLVASGGGASKATAIESVFDKVEASQKRKVTVVDAVPVQSGDARGLTGFYLVIGWTVGGYLVASLLGVSKGARPATGRRALIRLLSIVPYAIVSGLGGAIIVGPVLGALTGHLVALWWLGALLVFAAAAVTMAFQVLFGVLGIGITVLLFVVLGNPSAGGAYAPELLPTFWRVISGAIPNGAGTAAVRKIVYFHAHGITGNLLVIAAYAVVGTVVALVGATVVSRRTAPPADLSEGAFV